jgi:predicted membrane channel-forming protein YqfA (hemolysin III family)
MIISLILKNKYDIFKRIAQITYLLVIIGITRIFIFTDDNNPLISNDLSFLNYYLYSLFNNFKSSLVIFSIVYAHLNVIIFLFFRVFFDKIRTFFIILIAINVVLLVFNLINLNNISISLAMLIIDIISYFVGFIFYHILISE